MATNDAVSGIKPPANLQIDSDKSTSWKKWLQQFEWYATAIQLDKKPADVQAATFMAVIGSDAIEIYNSFNLSNADQNNLQIIKERFREYFAPKTNISFERYIFFKIEQNEDERFNEFLTRIKTQASKCEFDQLFDEMLKDKIVFGIRSSQVREKLLTEDRLDLNKAITICKTSELASKQLEEFEGKNRADKVLIVRNKNVKQEQNKYFDCRRCGTNYKSRECPAFNKPCTKCNKNGHFAKMCRTKKNNANKQKNRVNAIEESSNSDDEVYISTIITGEKKNLTENVQVGSVKFTVKLDTGAVCNVLLRHLMDKAKGKLKPSRTKNLMSCTDDRMAVLGETDLQCKLKNEKQNITFKIVEERVMPILGLNTCEKLGLIARVKTLKEGTDDIFEGLGCYKDYEYDIDLIENPKLEIKASRKIPHAIRHEVKQELDRMVKLDVIKPETAPTPAVSPMVIVKQKGKIRICIDPSDVNKNILRRHFPLTTIEEISADIQGSKFFALLDCTKGFWQIKLTERTQKILTFATPWGRYSFKRLPFGVSSAPEIFQEILTNLLSKYKNVRVSIDDIFIHAKSRDELQKTVHEVLETLKASGFKLNKTKCIFEATRIKFLGYIVSANGLEADPDKMPVQKNLGSALLQDGQPIGYGARALTKSEQNYPQIEKVALAILFGCKKFHEYVYGKELTVESDHKPLETIFKKNIQSAPARLQRIMFNLTPYSPKVIFKKGTEIPLADFLSRDCDASNLKYEQEENLKVAVILPMSLNAKEELINATKEDSHLQLLLKTIQQGFPEKVNELPTELQHYFNFKEELTYLKGIIFKGDKIVVPKSQIQKILKSIHQGHLGIQSCLRRARQFLYWKGQYDDIVKLVKSCSVCEQTQRDNCKNTVLVKKIPTLPWQIVSSDLFELKGKTYLVICNSYSGYLDFEPLKNQSSYEVIEQLKKWFSTHGVPEELQSDNGTQYMSREFRIFQKEWKFNHVTSSPHHHQGNGLAEKVVQTAKNILRKCSIDKSDVQLALLNWRKTPQNENLGSPNQRLFSRVTRSPIPTTENNLKPKLIKGVPTELQLLRETQVKYSNKHTTRPVNFEINDKVRHKVAHRQWEGARVVEKPEDLRRSLIIQTDKGQTLRRNFSHLHRTQADIISNKVVVPETKYTDVSVQAQSPELPSAPVQSSPSTPNYMQEQTLNQTGTAPRTSRFGRIIKPLHQTRPDDTRGCRRRMIYPMGEFLRDPLGIGAIGYRHGPGPFIYLARKQPGEVEELWSNT
ncbi:Uncharacterized protein K02A2.6 [Eumeta japonica]|uniref:RNA-directed DNA polymerase n=1 Tax=Eumeta variegata TaxID=151549 RepID=A0A4C1TJW9_EUMVA|nr:Uncharacterized protein K02A2.6 [Eumeta japonica]